MTLYDVVTKLVGPIQPVGETNEDNRRFENLKQLAKLVDKLGAEIYLVAHGKDRSEFSIRRAGEFADNFLDEMGITK